MYSVQFDDPTVEFAFAEVAADGTLRYVSPFGEERWGWSGGGTVPEELLPVLAEIAPGGSRVLPVLLGGLYVDGIHWGDDGGWIVVGHEAPSTDPDVPQRRDEGWDRQRRAEFLRTLSHEIRTPLGVTHGFADLVVREIGEIESSGTLLPHPLREFASSIRERSGRLMALAGDLLELSAIEAGHVSVERVPVRLRPLLAESVARLDDEIRARSLTLALSVPDDPVVLTDARRLQIVLDRIIGNAVRLAGAGSIAVKVGVEPGLVTIHVRDAGSNGLADAYRSRSNESPDQPDDWSGLEGGLGSSVVRRAISLLGGHIDAERLDGGGSTVWLTLPA